MKNCTPLWREAHFEVKIYKTPQCRTAFGSYDVEKAHAVVVRSTFRNQNPQNTPLSEHFWKLRCWKSARRCGAKHISKSKCTKYLSVGPFLEVAMSKKCTPLWREAHFQIKMKKKHTTKFGPLLEVKMSKKCRPLWHEAHFEIKINKTHHIRTTFGIQSSFRVAGARDSAPCQQQAKRKNFEAFSITFTTTPHYTPIHCTKTTTTPSLHSTTLHSTTPTTLHCTTLNCTQLHYAT